MGDLIFTKLWGIGILNLSPCLVENGALMHSCIGGGGGGVSLVEAIGLPKKGLHKLCRVSEGIDI